MSEAKKLYTAKLKSHTEEWTQAEHDQVKAVLGDRFNAFEVVAIQPEKPADVPSAPAKGKKDADAPAA